MVRRGRGGRRLASIRRRMLFTERALWGAGVVRVAGVDEVGMGPLAGPVVAAAVVLPSEVCIDGVRDSKLLNARQRIALDAAIREVALGIGIGVVDTEEVDRINVYQAGLVAMSRAVAALPVAPDHLLVDARTIPACAIAQTCVAQGDRTVYSIATASIVAKVWRDRIMADLDERYPGYGFARHAGYGTAAHLRALRSLGPSPVHRRSFAPVRAMLSMGGEGLPAIETGTLSPS
jgi:ribonuclease HII